MSKRVLRLCRCRGWLRLCLGVLVLVGVSVGCKPREPMPRAMFRVATQCERDPKAQFVDLHAHPFERFLRSMSEAPAKGGLLQNEMTFETIRSSGISLMVASIILPGLAELSLRYVHTAPPAGGQPHPQRELLQEMVRLEVAEEIDFIEQLVDFENQLVRHCARPTNASMRLTLRQHHGATSAAKKKAFLAYFGRLAVGASEQEWRRAFLADRAPLREKLQAQLKRWRKREQSGSRRLVWDSLGAFRRWEQKRWRTVWKRIKYFRRYLRWRLSFCEAGVFGKKLQIVHSAQEAADVMRGGGLAVVLELEQLGFLHEPDDVDFYYERGIRAATLTHLSDNCLSGSAHIPWDNAHIADRVLAPNYACTPQRVSVQRPCGKATCQMKQNANQGLTRRAMRVVRRMLHKGMLIDLTHLSQRSLEQLLGCVERHPKLFQPPLHSHISMWVSREGKLPENAISAQQLAQIVKGGGMVGFAIYKRSMSWLYKHVKPRPTLRFARRYHMRRDEARQLALAVDNGRRLSRLAPLGFGSDFNGFIDFPRSLRIYGHLQLLVEFLRREDCSIYQRLAQGGARFLALWRKSEAIAARWRKENPQEKVVCKQLQPALHRQCPWYRRDKRNKKRFRFCPHHR